MVKYKITFYTYSNDSLIILIMFILLSLVINVYMLIIEYIIISLIIMIYKTINNINKNRIIISTNKEITCCICLEDIKYGIQLNCTHILHDECFDNLINNGFKTCPLCIKPIV